MTSVSAADGLATRRRSDFCVIDAVAAICKGGCELYGMEPPRNTTHGCKHAAIVTEEGFRSVKLGQTTCSVSDISMI